MPSSGSPPPGRRHRPRRWLLRSSVIVVTLVTVFYVEENWRGTRAWHTVKADLEARKEPMTLEQLLPPVPDEENFYADPLIQERFRANDSNWFKFKEGNLSEIIAEAHKQEAKVDWSAALKLLRTRAAWPLPEETGRPAADLLAALAPADRGLQELRRALDRPQARLLAWQFAPSQATSGARFFIDSVRLLSLRSEALLEEKRPDDAARECVQALRLARQLSAQPANLMQFLVAAATSGTALGMLRTESGEIPWTVPQLEMLDAEIGQTHFADQFEFVLRAERVFALVWLEGLSPDGAGHGTTEVPFGAVFLPSGWRLKWKATLCDAIQQRIDGISQHGLRTEMNTSRKTGWFPPQPFAEKGSAFIHYQQMMERALLSDRKILSSRLALALMRWRLEKNVWPSSLTSLTAYFPDGIPVDPVTGQPFVSAPGADDSYIVSPPGGNAGNPDDDSVIKLRPPVRTVP